MHSTPVYKDVVLVGGGHSHALLIRQWAMQPLPGVRLTLVSENTLTPYSGMLPGLLAGHYTHEETHLDLTTLCHWAGVRFLETRMQAIDLQRKKLQLSERPDIEFDLLLLDTGSTPDLSVPGAAQFSTPVKPVSALFNRWQQLRENIQPDKQTQLAVVGSGAGGFEITMSLRHTLPESVAVHWLLRGTTALSGRPDKVGELALKAALDAGVVIQENFDVAEVSSGQLRAVNGTTLDIDEVLWCTGAAAPDWAKESGMEVCNRGFVATNDHLQSISHPFVFATGDIGTQIETPSDKAGVYAVRQAPVLLENVRRYLLNKPLKTYKPQKTFLSLMALGRKSAIANRGAITYQSDWLWRLKDHIDQKFMRQFRDLPPMKLSQQLFNVPTEVSGKSSSDEPMRCKGCGSKVAESVLHTVLSQLQVVERNDIDSGLRQLDDAAVFSIDKTRWVQSVDQISAIADDPYVFGKIAATHALSDVVTQTLDAHSAQAIVTMPYAGDDITRRDLSQLLAGSLEVLNAESCALVGGHTAEGSDTLLGFVVNGKLDEESAVGTGESLQPGDTVILCKALGTGIIMAGYGLNKSQGGYVQAALRQMQQCNRSAAMVFRGNAARRVTDVTGFGLLAHMHSLVSNESLGVHIDIDSLPLLQGARALAEDGIRSSLFEANSQVLNLYTGADQLSPATQSIVCDPQTSGGLLGIVPAELAEQAVTQLHEQGYQHACVIAKLSSNASSVLE